MTHTVEAVNLELGQLLIHMGGATGLASIDYYTAGRIDGPLLPLLAANLAKYEVWAHYKIGEEEFAIPLGTNVGDPVPISA